MNQGIGVIHSTTLSDSIGVQGLLVSMINIGNVFCKEVVISNCIGYYIKDYKLLDLLEIDSWSKALIFQLDWYTNAKLESISVSYIESMGSGIIYAGSFSRLIILDSTFRFIKS